MDIAKLYKVMGVLDELKHVILKHIEIYFGITFSQFNFKLISIVLLEHVFYNGCDHFPVKQNKAYLAPAQKVRMVHAATFIISPNFCVRYIDCLVACMGPQRQGG